METLTFKHGMNATGLVIPAGKSMEILDEHTGLLAAWRSDLQPQDTLQELLVESIAIRHWRLRQVYRAELAAVVETKMDNDCWPLSRTNACPHQPMCEPAQ